MNGGLEHASLQRSLSLSTQWSTTFCHSRHKWNLSRHTTVPRHTGGRPLLQPLQLWTLYIQKHSRPHVSCHSLHPPSIHTSNLSISRLFIKVAKLDRLAGSVESSMLQHSRHQMSTRRSPF